VVCLDILTDLSLTDLDGTQAVGLSPLAELVNLRTLGVARVQEALGPIQRLIDEGLQLIH